MNKAYKVLHDNLMFSSLHYFCSLQNVYISRISIYLYFSAHLMELVKMVENVKISEKFVIAK